jgi:hypothetical protein
MDRYLSGRKGLYSPPTNAYGLAGPAQASAGYHVVELPWARRKNILKIRQMQNGTVLY